MIGPAPRGGLDVLADLGEQGLQGVLAPDAAGCRVGSLSSPEWTGRSPAAPAGTPRDGEGDDAAGAIAGGVSEQWLAVGQGHRRRAERGCGGEAANDAVSAAGGAGGQCTCGVTVS